MCGDAYHCPTSCEIIKKWLVKCQDDSESANYITANTKDVSLLNCVFMSDIFWYSVQVVMFVLRKMVVVITWWDFLYVLEILLSVFLHAALF